MYAFFTSAKLLNGQEAQRRSDWLEWEKAECTKWKELNKAKTWTWVPIGELAEVGKKIISCKWTYEHKIDKKKARLCAHSF